MWQWSPQSMEIELDLENMKWKCVVWFSTTYALRNRTDFTDILYENVNQNRISMAHWEKRVQRKCGWSVRMCRNRMDVRAGFLLSFSRSFLLKFAIPFALAHISVSHWKRYSLRLVTSTQYTCTLAIFKS